MTSNKALTVDLTKLKESALVLPQSPTISSQQGGWRGVFLAHYRHPIHETLEHYLIQHSLIITDINSRFKTEHRLDGKFRSYLHGHGRLDVIPASLSHKATWDREIEFSLIALCPKFLEQVARESLKGDRVELIPQFSIVDPQIRHIALALKAEVEAGCTSGSLYGESLGTALALRLIQNYSVCKPEISLKSYGLPKYRLHQVIDYINAYLDRDISLVNLAEVAGMSQSHFTRLFKQSMGITPYQYLIQQRVERAKQLLQQPSVTIADVAFQCGFANQTHLTKCFRQLTGITPKTYRLQSLAVNG